MSDAGRKDFSTKIKETITPDSSKSSKDKVKENVTDHADKAARGVQSDHDKSTSQSLMDKMGRMTDNHSHTKH
ncbi:MAG: hypothetical protein M1835_003855 [Candelina submexicana]|nr:MAG: hypothetical protein M1835_003855 [Candelina submexicana]